MVSKQDNLDIAKDYFFKGEEKLKSAEILLKNELLDDSISRIYHSVYYFAKSLLYLLGEKSYTHKGLISIFGLKVIKTNLMDKKYGAILSDLLEKRERSDYDLYSFVDFDTTEKLLQDAIIFRDEIKRILNEKFALDI